MNVAGKSLQDIYDAGSKRLDELENAQTTAMNDTAEAHLDERTRVEPDSLKRLEDRTAELEVEIRSFLERGMERVAKAVAGEGQESEHHISRLVEGLVLLAKKFSESIGQLREAAESELSDLSADSQYQYKSNSDSVINRVREESTSALDASRTFGMQSQTGIGDQLEANWHLVYESETDAINGVTEAFHENTENVNQKSREARKNLEELVDHKLLTLEGKLSQAKDNLRSTVDTVTEQVERHAFDADVRLKEKFSSLLYEMSGSFDDSATRAAADIAGLHESSMADLTMKSQELSREMDSLAEDVTSVGSRRNEELQTTGSEMLQSYTAELTQRLDASNVFLKDIESERAQLVAEIWEELTGVKSGFEEKLSQLAQSTLQKMRMICDEAETAVVNAQQNCLTESKNHANSKREAIENGSRNFIDRVNSTRQAALDAIAKAAGATSEAEAQAAIKTEQSTEVEGSAAQAESGEGVEGEDDHSNPRPSDTATGMESRKRRDKKAGKGSDKRSGDGKK